MLFSFRNLIFTTSLIVTNIALAGLPIFSISPSLINTSTRSDSSTSITWTVTNNSTKTIEGISVDPDWASLGRNAGITVQNNECSAAALSASGSCTFSTLINGSHQPDSFDLLPKICAFNAAICSQPSLANHAHLSVINPASAHAYAYIASQSDVSSDEIIPFNIATLEQGTPLTDFNFTGGACITTSADGSKIYFTSAAPSKLYIASGGAAPTILGELLFSQGEANLDWVSLSPDEKTAYVARSTDEEGWVEIINIEDSTQPILEAIITLNTPVRGLAATRDGSKVYVLQHQGFEGSVFVINTDTYSIESMISIGGGAYSITPHPDGRKMYVGNTIIDGGVSYPRISVIDTLSDAIVANIALDEYATPVGIVVSPDGNRLYVSDANNHAVLIIDTQNHSIIGSPIVINDHISATGLSISPDGNTLFVITDLGETSIIAIHLDQDNAQESIPFPEDFGAVFQLGNFVG